MTHYDENQRLINEFPVRDRYAGDEVYFPAAHRLDRDRINGKPVWYDGLKEDAVHEFEDDPKYVFWEKVVEDWRDGDEYYYRTQWESFPDTSQKNPDIPVHALLTEQGHRRPKRWRETWSENFLRYRIKNFSRRCMDEADFTDRCIVRNGKLLALHMKGYADVQGPWHLRPETIRERLNRDEDYEWCTVEDAHTLSEAWTKLALSPTVVNKLIYGHDEFADGVHERKPGLKKAHRTLAPYFESIAAELPVLYADEEGQREIPQAEFDEIQAMRDEGAHFAAEDDEDWEFVQEGNYFVMRQTQYDDLDFNWVKGRVWYEKDDPDPENTAVAEFGPARDAVYSAHPLYWGAEGLKHDFINSIRTAKDLHTLNKIERRFRRRKGRGGKWYPPEFDYLTPSQKSQGWMYLNERREQLLAKVRGRLSKEVAETAKLIGECKAEDFDVIRARTLSHINGRTFRWAWQDIRYRAPRYEEAAYLRNELNKLERALRE